ncbi:MAG: hypothetical protein ACR2H3_04855, partial [Acidimicrobiales bacterium]
DRIGHEPIMASPLDRHPGGLPSSDVGGRWCSRKTGARRHGAPRGDRDPAPGERGSRRAVGEAGTFVTENAADFLPLLEQRQGAGLSMTPVLVALTADLGVGGTLHGHLAADIDQWAVGNPDPHAHAHWFA